MDETSFNESNIHGNQNKKELEQELRVLEDNIKALDSTSDVLSGIVDLKQNNYSLKNKS